jgi:hypothetical protein
MAYWFIFLGIASCGEYINTCYEFRIQINYRICYTHISISCFLHHLMILPHLRVNLDLDMWIWELVFRPWFLIVSHGVEM